MNKKILTVINILIVYTISYAQTPGNVFSSISLSASVISNTNENLLHRFWKPKHGFELQAEAPFYFGNIQFGVISIPFIGKTETSPDFSQHLIFLGTGNEISLPFKFNLYSGIRVGYLMMNFDDDTLSVYTKNESEFSAGVNFRLSYQVINNLFVNASTDFSLLFTYEKLKFYYISAGIAYRFLSPKWIKDFFN